MTVAPLPSARAHRVRDANAPVRAAPSRRSIASRRRVVLWTKRVLPLLALLLLAIVLLWPQIAQRLDLNRVGGPLKTLQEGRLLNLRYHGVDQRSRPYTVTAEEAQQVDAQRINLVSPKADMLSENGSWTMVVSENGVYIQHVGQLDLSGHVVVYRDTGVTLHTDSAALDMKAGAAAGNQPTHAEGPFGTLDAQGFAFVDKGAVVQFDGKSRLVLNEQQH